MQKLQAAAAEEGTAEHEHMELLLRSEASRLVVVPGWRDWKCGAMGLREYVEQVEEQGMETVAKIFWATVPLSLVSIALEKCPGLSALLNLDHTANMDAGTGMDTDRNRLLQLLQLGDRTINGLEQIDVCIKSQSPLCSHDWNLLYTAYQCEAGQLQDNCAFYMHDIVMEAWAVIPLRERLEWIDSVSSSSVHCLTVSHDLSLSVMKEMVVFFNTCTGDDSCESFASSLISFYMQCPQQCLDKLADMCLHDGSVSSLMAAAVSHNIIPLSLLQELKPRWTLANEEEALMLYTLLMQLSVERRVEYVLSLIHAESEQYLLECACCCLEDTKPVLSETQQQDLCQLLDPLRARSKHPFQIEALARVLGPDTVSPLPVWNNKEMFEWNLASTMKHIALSLQHASASTVDHVWNYILPDWISANTFFFPSDCDVSRLPDFIMIRALTLHLSTCPMEWKQHHTRSLIRILFKRCSDLHDDAWCLACCLFLMRHVPDTLDSFDMVMMTCLGRLEDTIVKAHIRAELEDVGARAELVRLAEQNHARNGE